jgi:hypothetical protein
MSNNSDNLIVLIEKYNGMEMPSLIKNNAVIVGIRKAVILEWVKAELGTNEERRLFAALIAYDDLCAGSLRCSAIAVARYKGLSV